MEQLFKKGDKVRLKSGGELMTVHEDLLGIDLKDGYFFDGSYQCCWFQNKKFKYNVFHQDTLEADQE